MVPYAPNSGGATPAGWREIVYGCRLSNIEEKRVLVRAWEIECIFLVFGELLNALEYWPVRADASRLTTGE